MPDDPTSAPGPADMLASGFRDLVGYRLVEWTGGLARLEIDLDERHMNRSGVVHGGVLTTMMDAAGGYAGTWCSVEANVRRCVTVSLTSHFLAPAEGGRLTATARLRGGGRRIFVSSIEVTDTLGSLIAIGDGTYRLRRGSEAPEGAPREPG